MPISICARRLMFATIALALSALLRVPAQAVEMEIFPGFDRVMKSTVWSPVGVKLTNPGGRTVEGTLEIRQDAPHRRPMPICSAKVSLPGNSTKLYYLYTRRHEYGGNMKVSLIRGARTIAAKDLTPMAIGRFDRLVVTVGDRSSKLHFLTGERVPLVVNAGPSAQTGPNVTAGGQADSTIQAASISPLMLPDRPAAYQSVDVMVISDLGSVSPDPKALKAIGMWVAGGGTLVVSTGPNYRSFRTDFFDDLLPVTITGAGSVPTLGALSQIGKTAFPGGPVAVSISTPKPGISTHMIEEGAVPVYAERRYGAGRVVFLAFDFNASPFRDWNGQTQFWKSVLTTSTAGAMIPENLEWMQTHGYPHGGYSPSMPSISLANVIRQNPSVKTPSINVIALYLLAYLIFLVPVNYLFVKRKRRMELAWITTPAIVLAFTIGAYAIGYTMKGGRIELGVAAVIEGSSNARYARVISDASLFSPARRTYDIDIKDPFAIGQCVPQETSEPMAPVYLGEKSTIEKINMAMWSSKTIESVSGADLGGVITSSLTLAGGQVVGTVTNNTNLDLTDCVVQFGGNQRYIGDLPSGKTAKVSPKSRPKSAMGQPGHSGDYARDLMDGLLGISSAAASGSGEPVLIGFAERYTPYGLSGSSGKITARTCCMFTLDVNRGSDRVFSPHVISAHITKAQNATQIIPDQISTRDVAMQISTNGFFEVVFQLPAAGNLELTRLSVTLRNSSMYPGGGPPLVKCFIADGSGAWAPLKDTGDVPNPGKYLQPGNRIRIRVESHDGNEINSSIGVSAAGTQK